MLVWPSCYYDDAKLMLENATIEGASIAQMDLYMLALLGDIPAFLKRWYRLFFFFFFFWGSDVL